MRAKAHVLLAQAIGIDNGVGKDIANVLTGFLVGDGFDPAVGVHGRFSRQPFFHPPGAGIVGRRGQHGLIVEARHHLGQIAGAQLEVGFGLQQSAAAAITDIQAA